MLKINPLDVSAAWRSGRKKKREGGREFDTTAVVSSSSSDRGRYEGAGREGGRVRGCEGVRV